MRLTAAVARETYRHHRTGRRQTREPPYATWRVSGDPVAVRDRYRMRFGVESSSRQLGQVRPRTSTADRVVRLLWVAVGLPLRNAWVRFGTAGGRSARRTGSCSPTSWPTTGRGQTSAGPGNPSTRPTLRGLEGTGIGWIRNSSEGVTCHLSPLGVLLHSF